jgi:tight adherence protein C
MVAAACLGCFLLTLSASLIAGYRLWARHPAGGPASGDARGIEDVAPFRFAFTGWSDAIERLGSALPVGDESRAEARRMLIAAGYRLPACVPIYFGLKACLSVVVPGLLAPFLYAVRPDAFAVAFAGAVAAYTAFRVPSWLVGFAARSRQEEICHALPDLIDLLVVGVESGRSLDQAMSEAARGLASAHPALTEELHVYGIETSAGTGRAEALRNLGRRTGEPDMRKFGSLLIQTERFGTGIARVLRTLARSMRIRRRQQAEELARQIAVKMIFPIFFLIMPSTFLVTAGPAILYLFVDMKKMLGID